MSAESLQSTRKPARVLLVTHSLGFGGAPKIALSVLERMGAEAEVRTISYAGGKWEDRCRALGPLDVMVRSIFGSKIPLKVSYRRLWWMLSKSARDWKPDVIYVNSAPALMAVAHLRLWNAPVLLHVHEMDSWLHRCNEEFPDLLRDLPASYIAVSEAVRDRLVNLCGVDRSKVKVIHAFADEKGFEEPPARSPKRVFTIGGCGAVRWMKGVDLWLLMADELRRIVGEDRVRFKWVGAADDEPGWEFREMARLLGIEQLIEFVPPTDKAREHFLDFDVFAMTSWEDPCPAVVLENMLLQTPVACFAGSGGASEEVGDTGVVIDSFSPRKMAGEIAKLIDDPERVRQMGAEARKRVLERFSSGNQTELIRQEILRLADSGSRPDPKWEGRDNQKSFW